MLRRPALTLITGFIVATIMLVCSGVAENPTARLQSAVNRIMRGKSGTAVILDVDTGRLLASSSLDIAARRLAAPGSAIKPFTLLALLRTAQFDPGEAFVCPRKLSIASKTLDCTHPLSPSGFHAVEALAYSCNNYFAAASSRVPIDDLRQQFEESGLFSLTGLAPREATGHMSSGLTQEQVQLAALGEGEIVVTPLEMLQAYRKLAQARTSQADDKNYNLVFRGLEASVSYGMAHAAQTEGLAVAGKTGTAAAADSPAATHGWFVGYAPAGHPAIVLVVYLEHGRGIDAAVLAHDLFAAWARGAR
jgi:cell division protein FtsI/penicillin-binding protein 2